MKTPFSEKLKKSTPAIGVLLTLDAPEIAEIFSLCGFDWLFLDMEHSALSVSSVQHMLQAVQGDCSTIVRVPENSAVWIKKALDTGCDGVIVPQVNSAEDARRAVSASKYPPLGSRSVGIARAHAYGMSFSEYVAKANENTALIVQIEHIQAVNNIDEILSVDGIDAVLIGPYDLSGSMNMLGNVTSEPVQTAINNVKRKCIGRSIPVGMFVMKAESVKKEADDGCRFIAVGLDSSLLWNGAKDVLFIAKGI